MLQQSHTVVHNFLVTLTGIVVRMERREWEAMSYSFVHTLQKHVPIPAPFPTPSAPEPATVYALDHFNDELK